MGALLGTDEDVKVRVDLKNTGDERLARVRVGGDLLGRHADGTVGDVEPGHTASALLTFPFASEWRPGRHVLPLRVDYGAGSGPFPTLLNFLAYLILPLAGQAEPALRVEAKDVALDIRAPLPVRLESADGRPHRARVRVLTPHGLVAPDPPPVVEVPPRGGITVEVALLQGAAAPGSRQGILVVVDALDGPIERMAVATSAVDIAPDPAWLGSLRAPLLVAALVLLGAGGLAERHRARS